MGAFGFSHAWAYHWGWLPLRFLLMPLLWACMVTKCMKIVKASQEYCLWTLSQAPQLNKGNTPGGRENWPSNTVAWEEKRKKQGGEKDWGPHITLATKVGVCIIPRVLVILENIKACWLSIKWQYRNHKLVIVVKEDDWSIFGPFTSHILHIFHIPQYWG